MEEQLLPAYYIQGDVIGDIDPYVKILKRMYKRQHCSNCFAPQEKFVNCKRVKRCEARYCNSDCQRDDWMNGHGIECMLMQFEDFEHSIFEHQPSIDLKFLLIRLFALQQFFPEVHSRPNFSCVGPDKSLNDLMQLPTYALCEVLMSNLLSCSQILTYFQNEIAPGSGTEADLDRYPPLIVQHACSIDGGGKTGIGWAIYIESKFIPHSCKPNCVILQTGTKKQMRAISTIFQGDTPTINYLSDRGHLTKDVRKWLLMERFQVECYCERCILNSDSLMDYDKMNFLVSKMHDVLDEPGIAGYSWACISELHADIVNFLRCIYSEHDTHITDQFMKTLTIGMNQKVSKRILVKFATDVFVRISITYGPDHMYFAKYQSRLKWYFGEKWKFPGQTDETGV